MRKVLFLVLLVIIGMGAKAQFPTTDSLRNYNTRFTTNSAINWFTNLRGQTLLRGIIDHIDSASSSGGIDTLYALNDSTVRYTKNGTNYNVIVRGTGGSAGFDTLYIKKAGTGTALHFVEGDSLKIKAIQAGSNITITQNADSSITIDASGGGGGSTNTSVGSGYSVAINGTNNIKSLTQGYGSLIDSATSNQVNIKVDTATIYGYTRSVFNSGDTIVINNTGASGVKLARSANDTLNFKRIVAGTNVTITENADSSLTIASSGGGVTIDSAQYLKNGGNPFTAATSFGSNTNFDVALKANNAEIMRLNAASGQVLVGTTTPLGGYKMVVNGYFGVQSQEARFLAGAQVSNTLNTGSSNNLVFNTPGAPNQATSQPIYRFTSGNPSASSGTSASTLMDLYKPIQRGTSIWDNRETILRLRASIISGVADDIRGIWQDTGFNLLNVLGGSTYIGYDSTKKDNRYKFNVNGSVLINKDSLPTSTLSSASFVGINNTTGQLIKLNSSEGTYTPTITNNTNIGTSSITVCHYQRVGDYVEVFGEVTIDPTATGDTQLTIDLPIAADVSNSYDLSGSGVNYDNNQVIRIYPFTGQAVFRLNASVDASSHVYSFRFKYKYTNP